jgi:transposase InsO family protein
MLTAQPTNGVDVRREQLDFFVVDEKGAWLGRPCLELYIDKVSGCILGSKVTGYRRRTRKRTFQPRKTV